MRECEQSTNKTRKSFEPFRVLINAQLKPALLHTVLLPSAIQRNFRDKDGWRPVSAFTLIRAAAVGVLRLDRRFALDDFARQPFRAVLFFRKDPHGVPAFQV